MGFDYALVAIAGIVLIVAAAAFSSRLGVAAPLLLVLVGIGYSFIPGVPVIEVEPEFILMGVRRFCSTRPPSSCRSSTSAATSGRSRPCRCCS
jgi:hypothetical protein